VHELFTQSETDPLSYRILQFNLLGNIQAAKHPRQMTKAVDPRLQAVWTLADLYEFLCEWAYEVYDQMDHPALFQSPRDAFAQGVISKIKWLWI
jgi:putative transposase